MFIGCHIRKCQQLHWLHSRHTFTDDWLWESYCRRKQKVSIENWGIDNEVRAFLVSPDELDATNLHNFQSSRKHFSTKASVIHRRFNNKTSGARKQMLVCSVAAGRVLHKCGQTPSSTSTSSILKCQSEMIRKDLFFCCGPCLAYPEYIITYRAKSVGSRNTHHLGVDVQQTSSRSESKMCVICMERHVRYLTIQCGYVFLLCHFFLIYFACTHFYANCFLNKY